MNREIKYPTTVASRVSNTSPLIVLGGERRRIEGGGERVVIKLHMGKSR
jgi:hypothetical protein